VQSSSRLRRQREIDYAGGHAYGASLDKPGLLVAGIVVDGEAKTGALLAATKLTSSI